MPLLDHFTEPVDPRRKWATFHAYWATTIGRWLNRTLPERFFAAINVHHFVVDAFIWRLRKDSNYAVVSAQPAVS